MYTFLNYISAFVVCFQREIYVKPWTPIFFISLTLSYLLLNKVLTVNASSFCHSFRWILLDLARSLVFSFSLFFPSVSLVMLAIVFLSQGMSGYNTVFLASEPFSAAIDSPLCVLQGLAAGPGSQMVPGLWHCSEKCFPTSLPCFFLLKEKTTSVIFSGVE